MTRHLLDIEGLEPSEIETLLARTGELAAGAAAPVRTGTVANLFLEPSTRTRVSFQMAARRLGLDAINIDQRYSSASKGESLEDTVRTLGAMGVRAVVLRHPKDFAADSLASALENGPDPVGIINAGDGQHAHPSQALLDAATIAHAGLDLAGLKLAIIGDIRHSRVARSDIALFSRLGAAEIRIAGPDEFMPDAGELPEALRAAGIDAAIDGVDAVICLRIQRERILASGIPDGNNFREHWGLTPERAASMPSHARILHPGPVIRNVEMANALIDSPRSLILEQVRMGVHLRTALFEWLVEDTFFR